MEEGHAFANDICVALFELIRDSQIRLEPEFDGVLLSLID